MAVLNGLAGKIIDRAKAQQAQSLADFAGKVESSSVSSGHPTSSSSASTSASKASNQAPASSVGKSASTESSVIGQGVNNPASQPSARTTTTAPTTAAPTTTTSANKQAQTTQAKASTTYDPAAFASAEPCQPSALNKRLDRDVHATLRFKGSLAASHHEL